MPHLRHCEFESGDVKDEDVARETVLKETCCARLNSVSFRDSFAPPGIISVIAKKNPNLEYCVAPTNVTDDDIRQLQLRCPLNRFHMSLTHYDPLTPCPLVSVRGLSDLSRMLRVDDILLHARVISLVDRDLLSQWAWSSKFEIVEFRKCNMPLDVKVFLSGDESFKEWMAELVKPSNVYHWRINMDKLRDALGNIGLES
jgi:hypothetical protein